MSKPDSTSPETKNRVEARAPRGLADREAGELAATNRMLDVIRSVYELYGFEALETLQPRVVVPGHGQVTDLAQADEEDLHLIDEFRMQIAD